MPPGPLWCLSGAVTLSCHFYGCIFQDGSVLSVATVTPLQATFLPWDVLTASYTHVHTISPKPFSRHGQGDCSHSANAMLSFPFNFRCSSQLWKLHFVFCFVFVFAFFKYSMFLPNFEHTEYRYLCVKCPRLLTLTSVSGMGGFQLFWLVIPFIAGCIFLLLSTPGNFSWMPDMNFTFFFVLEIFIFL